MNLGPSLTRLASLLPTPPPFHLWLTWTGMFHSTKLTLCSTPVHLSLKMMTSHQDWCLMTKKMKSSCRDCKDGEASPEGHRHGQVPRERRPRPEKRRNFKKCSGKPKTKNRARKQVTQMELRQYRLQFQEAKQNEHKSWVNNDVYDLIDMWKHPARNFVKGRWVLTLKRDKDGKCQKCKSIWVLKGVQDKQTIDQQTDSPTSARPRFRMSCELATNRNWDLFHVDLKTAILQGESYESFRDEICQLPPETEYPPYIGARLKRPAYGLNDARRRWWNRLDTALRRYGLVPTRADRCCYAFIPRRRRTHNQDPQAQ